jgi:hypothetical protein
LVTKGTEVVGGRDGTLAEIFRSKYPFGPIFFNFPLSVTYL